MFDFIAAISTLATLYGLIENEVERRSPIQTRLDDALKKAHKKSCPNVEIRKYEMQQISCRDYLNQMISRSASYASADSDKLFRCFFEEVLKDPMLSTLYLSLKGDIDIVSAFLCNDVCRYNLQFEQFVYKGLDLSVSDLFIPPICSLNRLSDNEDEVIQMSKPIIEECKTVVQNNGLLLIKGQYGSGKTILTKALLGELRKDGFCVCFQANSLTPRFFSELRSNIEKCLTLFPKLYIFIDSCELLLADQDFVYDVSTLLNDFDKRIHFIINYRSIQDNETDLILKNFTCLLSPVVLNLRHYDNETIQKWLDRFNATREGSGRSVITYDDIQRTNKNLKVSCKNPLILYMVSSNDNAKTNMLDKNWYAVFDEFIKKTTSGKYESEKDLNPLFKKYNWKKEQYFMFLADVANLVKRNSDSVSIMGQATEDDFFLDKNETQYSVEAKEIIQFVPEEIAVEFNSSKREGTIPESLIQALTCYFFEVSKTSCRFKDNNILLFFKAYNYIQALKKAIQAFEENDSPQKCVDIISDVTEGMLFHPVEIEFILNSVEQSELQGRVSDMIFTMIYYGHILNIEERRKCRVDYEKIKTEVMLCIIYMKFTKWDYNQDKLSYFFKRLSHYHSFVKLVDTSLSSVIQRYFNHIRIAGAEFRRINLKNYNFNGSTINETTFIQCKLENSSIKNITCKGAEFDMCLISHITDSDASVSGTLSFIGCKLSDVIINVNRINENDKIHVRYQYEDENNKEKFADLDAILLFQDCVIEQLTISSNSKHKDVKIFTRFKDCIIKQCTIKGIDNLFISIPKVILYKHIDIECNICNYLLDAPDAELNSFVKTDNKSHRLAYEPQEV